MTVPAVIPFAVSAVVMLWAIWGTIWAFRGGIHSGLHDIATTERAKADSESE